MLDTESMTLLTSSRTSLMESMLDMLSLTLRWTEWGMEDKSGLKLMALDKECTSQLMMMVSR